MYAHIALRALGLLTRCVVGCMETLVHYKQLLVRAHADHYGPDGVQALKGECRTLLGQLEDLDPKRRQRYRDLGVNL
jgi:geranylgeranyl transferase type-2 subunit alpha